MNGCSDPTCTPPPCVYPPPPPKSFMNAGVKCCQFPPQTCRVAFTLPTQPDFVLDHNEPIVVEWPPKKEPVCEYVDTGPRPDLLAQIPHQIAPQVVTMIAAPQMVNSDDSTMTNQVLPHERCPDSQLHVRIEPKQKKKVEIRMPPQEPPIRGPPCRPWIQCVENTLITDQVRRPLARYCHRRPMPPLVIPTHKLEQLKLKSTERQRQREEEEAYFRERECQRLKSRQRQAKWNFTVESLLDRKRQKEQAQEEAERESTRQLMAEVAQEKNLQSEAQIARADQLILYRKGLIRDFHSALAYSKMMQEIDQMKSKSGEQDDSNCPMYVQKCYKKMMYPNTSRPDYSKKVEEKVINEKLLQRLKCIEQRALEQKMEINSELCSMKQLIAENMPDLPEKYKKYMADPVCDEDNKERTQEKMRCDVFEEIGDKLAADAYIESHENEIDRQACEYNEYKRRVDAIRKAKEKQLIDEKVAYNIAKSEVAARALVKVQQEKKARANDYDKLKEQWESEFEAKEDAKKSAQEKHMAKVIADFNRRKCAEGWKQCDLHPARQWASSLLVAEENFERECQEKSDRRLKAEDIALYNKAQASNKQCHEQRKKYMDDVWAAKMKQEYLEEMKEMKSYAQQCIEDWKAKGRTAVPMHQAMKKWDYDAGMQPYLFAEGDAPLNLAMSKQMAKSAKNTNCPGYETTSKRLGFGSGGCA